MNDTVETSTTTGRPSMSLVGWLLISALGGAVGGAMVAQLPRQGAAATADKAALNALSQRLDRLTERVVDLAFNVIQFRHASLDPTDKSFARVDANNGIFYIILDNVTPYLNGQKLTLRIGNPQYAAFKGFDMELSWGKPDAKTFQSKSKTEKSSAILMPGRWTQVEIVIAPATSDEIQAGVSVSMTTNSITLGTGY